MALGNHEFDFGPDVARTRIGEANFTMLSNNALEPDGTLIDGVEESMMLEVGDHTVGIFGLTTAGTAVKSSPGDVTFSDPVEVAASMSASLREAGADVVGVDWRIPLAEARRRVPSDRALQGNLDPAILGAPWEVVAAEVDAVLESNAGHPGHIFNLGHGVLPMTNPEQLERVVELVHSYGRADGSPSEGGGT